MTFKPAHKEASITAPGQVRHEEQGHKTLSEYIRTIKRAEAFDAGAAEKKLTFDEWWCCSEGQELSPWGSLADYTAYKVVWNAALKNAPGAK